jgi:hypothetical protein
VRRCPIGRLSDRIVEVAGGGLEIVDFHADAGGGKQCPGGAPLVQRAHAQREPLRGVVGAQGCLQQADRSRSRGRFARALRRRSCGRAFLFDNHFTGKAPAREKIGRVARERVAICRRPHDHVAAAEEVLPCDELIGRLRGDQLRPGRLLVDERLVEILDLDHRGARWQIDGQRVQKGPGRCGRRRDDGAIRAVFRRSAERNQQAKRQRRRLLHAPGDKL